MSATDETGGEEPLRDDLSNYNADRYKKPSVTVDIVICTLVDGDLKVLLIKRKHPPFRDQWAIPGGFVEIDKNEPLDRAAARELWEETGVRDIVVEQLKTYGDTDRDPRTRVITVAYYALVPWERLKGQKIEGRDDAKEAMWFSLSDPPRTAFDHALILEDTLERIRGKITYAPLAFRLVPEKFTWAELKAVYETVLGRRLTEANFRRWIRRNYRLQEYRPARVKGRPGRPAAVLSYRWQRKGL